MRKKLFIPLLLAVLSFLSFYALSFFSRDDIVRHLERWQIRLDLAGFTPTDFSTAETAGTAKESLEAERAGTIAKITKTEAISSEKYIEDKKFLLDSLFLPTTSPYPGVITNVIECPEQFKPAVVRRGNGVIYTLFAGARFTYGICAQDLVAYYSTYGIFDCKEKGVFEARIFSRDEKEPQTIIQSFHCQ